MLWLRPLVRVGENAPAVLLNNFAKSRPLGRNADCTLMWTHAGVLLRDDVSGNQKVTTCLMETKGPILEEKGDYT